MYIYVYIIYICTSIGRCFSQKSFSWGDFLPKNLFMGKLLGEIYREIYCSVSLMLTLNWDTDTLFEKLKKVTSTMTSQNVLSEVQAKNVFI